MGIQSFDSSMEDNDLIEEKLKEILEGILYFRCPGGKCTVIFPGKDPTNMGKLGEIIRADLVNGAAYMTPIRYDYDQALHISVVAPTEYILPNFEEENLGCGSINTTKYPYLAKKGLTFLTLHGADSFTIRGLCEYIFTKDFLDTYFPTDLFKLPKNKHFYLGGVRIVDGEFLKFVNVETTEEMGGKVRLTRRGLEFLSSPDKYLTEENKIIIPIEELKKYKVINLLK